MTGPSTTATTESAVVRTTLDSPLGPLLVLRPCHRVIGADGSLTGYAGGLDRKRLLLALERAAGPRGTPVPPPA